MASTDRRIQAMIAQLRIFILSLPILAGSLFGQSLQPEEYSWDNPTFRNQFTATYGVLSDVEPRVTTEEQTFLRETVLPLVQKDPAQAVAVVSQKIGETGSPALYFVLGNIFLQQNQLDAARQNLQRAVALFPNFRRAYRSLALLEVRANRYPASIPYWIKVIRLGGGDDQSFGLLGYAYLQESQWAAAIGSFEQALVFRADSRDLRRGLVHALIQSSQPEEATALVRDLLNEDAEDPQLWNLLANFHLAKNELRETAAALEVSVRLNGPQVDSLLLLGNVYTSLGLPAKALAAYVRVLQIPRADIDFSEAFRPVEILLEQRLWSEVSEYAAVLRSSYGRDLTSEENNLINAALVTARLHTDPTPDLAEMAESYASVFPMDGQLQLALGDYYASENKSEPALLAYRRAASVPQFRYEAKLRLANMLVTQQRYNEAVQPLRELQEIQYSIRVDAFLARLEEFQDNL